MYYMYTVNNIYENQYKISILNQFSFKVHFVNFRKCSLPPKYFGLILYFNKLGRIYY